MPELLSVSQATEYLKSAGLDLGRPTLRQLIAENKLPVIQPTPRKLRIRRDALDRLLGRQVSA
jgi:excisionase family DNA binding protein